MTTFLRKCDVCCLLTAMDRTANCPPSIKFLAKHPTFTCKCLLQYCHINQSECILLPVCRFYTFRWHQIWMLLRYRLKVNFSINEFTTHSIWGGAKYSLQICSLLYVAFFYSITKELISMAFYTRIVINKLE